MVNKKGAGPKKGGQEALHRRRDEMREYMEVNGYFSATAAKRREWGKKYNVSNVQIHKDIKWIISQIELPTVKEVSHLLENSYKKAIESANRLVNNEDPSISAKGTKMLAEVSTLYTRFLEDYGIKDKIANKMEVKTENTLKSINVNIEKNLDNLDEKQRKTIREAMYG